MPQAVFPYPGGKSRLASWILEYLPEHRTYVEVFGGAAGVLVNKPRSKVEVYNDLDADLVQFFEVLRDRSDELIEWLNQTPYSRDLHGTWAGAFYNGYRPADAIERAGQFFYLRYTQWGGAYDNENGFATAKTQSRAVSFNNKRERLTEFAERFDGVTIENLDWKDVFERYDSSKTVFYCDPPYVGVEDYYPHSSVGHENLVDVLDELEGDCILSYSDLPAGTEDYYVVGQESRNYMGNGKTGKARKTEERLVLNFDPGQRNLIADEP
ncbi:DNA adenine methylase [Haloprofundus sp. MHR1]|uniref:DNA adenine methylase n=1 Tax=Haloprofundus sp. MHR1 TaxID=2572921 RepID=UPI0010BEA4EB|nr:DNA adenine methylase [Haloprofundus sp. MHR1]QCJ47236.1 DNA adenine methylase [Haloprofundus sp. MHR1]